MIKSTNTKWFTLVELIIVITILAILATIAFISFQGYSKEARNSKVKSEIANITKVISVKQAEGSPITTFISWGTAVNPAANVQWTGATNHLTWTLNQNAVAINSNITYQFATIDNFGWVYQIRGALEPTEAEPEASYTAGTYFPRAAIDIINTDVTVSGNSFTLTGNDKLWLLKVGDTNGTDTVTKISSDLKTITFSGATAPSSFTVATESGSLFGGN